MMTPQEVANRSFQKATLGGYNLAMVDEFLDELTEDYTALYNDNAILKNKLKVLSDTVEEYRATDNAMRKTLLAAQQMADAMVSDAEKHKEQLEREAQEAADRRIAELNAAIAAEDYRLRQAQEATAAYVRKLAAMHEQEIAFLSSLGELVPPDLPVRDDPGAEIEAAVAAKLNIPEADGQTPPQAEPAAVHAAAPQSAAGDDYEELDPEATRRFSDMQFGKDYKIE